MNQPTIIKMSSYDTTMTWEIPYSDTTIDQIMEGIVACLGGLGWNRSVIMNGMRGYLEENDDEVYDSGSSIQGDS